VDEAAIGQNFAKNQFNWFDGSRGIKAMLRVSAISLKAWATAG
jgi:hypothetical protein